MAVWKLAAITAFTAAGLAVAAPASAQSNNSTAMQQCDGGSASACLSVAMELQDAEDPENPVQTLAYSRRACDGNANNGCLYYAMINLRAGLYLHQRIISASLEGDPKGEWRYKSDLNAAIDRAQAYYRTARSYDESLADDWDDKLENLEGLRQ